MSTNLGLTFCLIEIRSTNEHGSNVVTDIYIEGKFNATEITLILSKASPIH